MRSALQLLRLLAVVVWVGGLVFFAFVLAPTAFHTLSSARVAGLLVGASLRVFDVIALVCGAVFLGATLPSLRGAETPSRRQFGLELLLIGVMMLLTTYLHAGMLPAMERDRAQAGEDISTAPATDPARMHFDRLHAWSERLEGGVLLLGLAVVVLMSREQPRREQPRQEQPLQEQPRLHFSPKPTE